MKIDRLRLIFMTPSSECKYSRALDWKSITSQ